MMKMSSFATGLFALSLALFDCGSQAQPVKLKIETKECAKGVVMNPSKVSVSVFDPSTVSKIVEMALDYELSASRINEEGADKAESKYFELRRRVDSAKALARSKHISAPGVVFALPPVRRIIIFGFGETKTDFRYARRVMDLIPGRTKDIVLNFSTDEECKNAK
jgi:hypothetical protein